MDQRSCAMDRSRQLVVCASCATYGVYKFCKLRLRANAVDRRKLRNFQLKGIAVSSDWVMVVLTFNTVITIPLLTMAVKASARWTRLESKVDANARVVNSVNRRLRWIEEQIMGRKENAVRSAQER